jgi:hypothetical protein
MGYAASACKVPSVEASSTATVCAIAGSSRRYRQRSISSLALKVGMTMSTSGTA